MENGQRPARIYITNDQYYEVTMTKFELAVIIMAIVNLFFIVLNFYIWYTGCKWLQRQWLQR